MSEKYSDDRDNPQDAESNSWPQWDDYPQAAVVRKNLRFLGQVNRNAGMTGRLQLYVFDREDSKEDPVVFLSLDEIDALTDEDCIAFISADTSGSLVGAETKKSTAPYAILAFKLMGKTCSVPMTEHNTRPDSSLARQQRETAWASAQDEKKLLLKHKALLESVGAYADLDEGEWRERESSYDAWDRTPILSVVAVFERAIEDPSNAEDHPVKRALWELTSLGGRQREEIEIDLRRPILGLEHNASSRQQLKTMDIEKLVALAPQWAVCGGSHDLLESMASARRRRNPEPKVNFLVPGLIPKGAVTLFAGSGSLGKSTMMQELATAAGTPIVPGAEGTWLGIPLAPEVDPGLVVMIAGEDGNDIVDARQQVLDPEGRATLLTIKVCNKGDFRKLMADLRTVPNLRLVIVDPTRKFMDGDEQGSEHASDFFDQLESLASATGCAVIATHHFTKGANPRNKDAVRQVIRGSGVFSDRPRVVIGGYRTNAHTHLIVAKHNIPPGNGMLEETLTLVRDPLTLRHLPVTPAAARADAAEPAKEPAELTLPAPVVEPVSEGRDRLDRCLEALSRLTHVGKVVNRTGNKSLYGWKPQELKGLSRKIVDRCVQDLIRSGAIVIHGSRIVPAAPRSPEAAPTSHAA